MKKNVNKNKRMKIARVERDITQGELADNIGISRQTIGLIESGHYNPSLRVCVAICRELGKTLDELFWPDEVK